MLDGLQSVSSRPADKRLNAFHGRWYRVPSSVRTSDRGLKRVSKVPGKVDPGVLANFGDVGVNLGAAFGFCVDRCNVSAWEFLAHQLRCLAGVDQVIDDQDALGVHGSDTLVNVFEYVEVFQLFELAVRDDADGVDHPEAEFARDDRCRNKAAAGDADQGFKRAGAT